MPLFYPFGIPSTSSYSAKSDNSYLVKATPGFIQSWSLYAESGPKGPVGTPAVGCPPGFLDASVENTVVYSGSTGFHAQSYPPVPYKGRRTGVDTVAGDSFNRNNSYILCYPVPTPTPTNALPASIVRLTAISSSVTASLEVIPGSLVDAAVQVRNSAGNGVGYPVPVTWSIDPKRDNAGNLMPEGTQSGSIVSSSNVTDAYGNSQITAWIAGPITGSQYIRATGSGSLSGNPVMFYANIVASSSYHTSSTAFLDQYTTIAGNTRQLTVVVRDIYGNLRTDVNGTYSPSNTQFVATAVSGASLSNFSCTNGYCTSTVTTNTAIGTRAVAEIRIGGELLTTQPDQLITLPHTPSFLVITGSAAQIAGASQNITVTAYDQYSNICNSGSNNYTGGKSLTFSGAESSPNGDTPTVASTNFGSATSVSFTNGVVSGLSMVLYDAQDVSGNTPETDVIQVTDGSISTSQAAYRLTVVVDPATVSSLQVTGAATQIAGASQTVTITARDQYRNKVSSGANNYTGAKNITFSGASASPGSNTPTFGGTNFGSAHSTTFTNGVATGAMILYDATSQPEVDTIDASDGSVNSSFSGDTLTVSVSPATASSLKVTGTATQIAGASQTVTITARDAYRNVVASGTNIYSGNKNITLTGATASPGGDTPTFAGTNFGSAVIRTFTAGVATGAMILYDAQDNPEVDVIDASDGSINSSYSGDTLTVSVSPAVASSLKVTGNATQIAGDSQTVTITAFDAYRNTVASGANNYNGSKTITLTGATASPSGNTPTFVATNFGTGVSRTFTNGVATGAMILYDADDNPEVDVIDASDGSINSSYSGDTLTVSVSPATAAALKITGNSTQTAGSGQTITITAYDTYRNRVLSGTNVYTGTKTLTFSGASTSPGGNVPTFAGTNFGTGTSTGFSNGVATGTMILYTDETVDIATTDSSISAAGSDRLNVDVAPAAASSLKVTGTSTQTAGGSQTVTITAYDAFRNVALGYTGAKNITLSGATASPGGNTPTFAGTNFGSAVSRTFTDGVGSGAMVLYDAQDNPEVDVIDASDGSINSSYLNDTLTVSVSPATAATLKITGTASQTAGTGQTITITAQDAYRNTVGSGGNNYTGDKNLTYSGANQAPDTTNPTVTNKTASDINFGSTTVTTFSAGVATATMKLYKAESVDVAVTDSSISAAGSDRLSVTVNRTTTTMTVKQGDSQTATVNTAVATVPEVYIRDTYLNPHVGHTVTWSVIAGGGSRTNATNNTDSNGVATVGGWTLGTTSAASPGVGGNTLRAAASGYSNVDFTATAQPGATTQYTVTTPGTQTAGVGFNVTISARDVYSNLVDWGANDYDGTYTVTMTGPNDAPDGTVPTMAGTNRGSGHSSIFSGGQFTPSIVLYKAETTTLTFTTSGITAATTNNITVNSNTAVELKVTGQNAAQAAGDQQTITVTALDDYRNTATGYTGDKNLTYSGASSSPGGNNPTVRDKDGVARNFGVTTVTTFSSGVASRIMELYKAETVDVAVTDGSISATGADRFNVTVAPAFGALFVITGNGTQTAGASQNITITTLDAYRNTATGYAGSKTVTFSGATVSSLGNNPTVLGTNFGTGTTVSFTAGVASSLAMVLYKVETATIVATEGARTTSGADRLSVVVSNASVSRFRNIVADDETVTAGQDFNVTITLEDAYGNDGLDMDTYKDMYFYGPSASPDGTAPRAESEAGGGTWVPFMGFAGSGGTGRTFVDGVETFPVTLFASGTHNISVSDEHPPDTGAGYTNTVATNTITVSAGTEAASDSTASLASTTVVAGQTTTLSIAIKDAYGNLRNGTYSETAATGSLSGLSNPIIGGYNYTYNPPDIAGTYTNAITVTVGGNNVVGSPLSVTTIAAATSKLGMHTEPSNTVTYQQTSSGFSTPPAVRTQDPYNNNTSDSGYGITASIDIPGGSLYGVILTPYTESVGSGNITTNGSGIATFTNTTIRGFLGSGSIVFSEIPLQGWTDVTSTTNVAVYGILTVVGNTTSTNYVDCGGGCTGEGDANCCFQETVQYEVTCSDAYGTPTPHLFTNGSTANERVGVRVQFDTNGYHGGGHPHFTTTLISNGSSAAVIDTIIYESAPGETSVVGDSVTLVSASNSNWHVIINA